MFRNLILSSVMAVAACASTSNVRAADEPHHEHFLKCAKACADCQVLCDMCFHHCAALVVKGDKNHGKTMQTCVDCADCCKLAATLGARQSPFAAAACECCAKCCDECATACEAFPDDKHMARMREILPRMRQGMPRHDEARSELRSERCGQSYGAKSVCAATRSKVDDRCRRRFIPKHRVGVSRRRRTRNRSMSLFAVFESLASLPVALDLIARALPSHSIFQYETEVKSAKLLLVAHGSAGEVKRAKDLLEPSGVSKATVHAEPADASLIV